MEWYKTGVMYNLYLRSFRDGNNDGVGDLPGALAELDTLRDLGMDILWISGMLDSPWKEFGFDARDYTAIHPQMGTMDDFDAFLGAAHERGMKVMVDFIPNHTSDQHAWFQESKSSRDNPKRDWYIWRDARPDGTPPNNWISPFGASMWEWDEDTGQFYLHTFLKEQPDLNWRNPEVIEAMKGVLRFWLDRGVDGFRVDAAHHIIKDDLLRDNPPDPSPRMVEGRTFLPETQLHVFDREQYGIHAIYRELRKVLDEYSTPGNERAWVAEIHPAGWGAWIQYFGPNNDEFHFPFSNGLVFLEWKAQAVRIVVDTIEGYLPPFGWPNAHTGNFDEKRMVTRVGEKQARVAAMLLMTLRGTPMLYYGEEIGMEDVEIPEELAQDRMGKQIGNSRDPQRTPMQWTPAPGAGFSNDPTVQPWLPMSPEHKTVNVRSQRASPGSLWNLYRRTIECRRANPALVEGSYRPIDQTPPGIYAFLREHEGERVLVALNFSDQLITLAIPGMGSGTLLLSTTLEPEREGTVNLSALTVHPDEGVIVRME